MSPNIYLLNVSAHHASFIEPVPVFSVYPPLRPQIIKNVGRKLRRNFYPRHNSDTRHQEAGSRGAEGGALRDFPVPTVQCPGSPRVPAATFTLGPRTPRSQPEYFIPGQISDGRRDGD